MQWSAEIIVVAVFLTVWTVAFLFERRATRHLDWLKRLRMADRHPFVDR